LGKLLRSDFRHFQRLVAVFDFLPQVCGFGVELAHPHRCHTGNLGNVDHGEVEWSVLDLAVFLSEKW